MGVVIRLEHCTLAFESDGQKEEISTLELVIWVYLFALMMG